MQNQDANTDPRKPGVPEGTQKQPGKHTQPAKTKENEEERDKKEERRAPADANGQRDR
jgi:hypothetical protein